MVRLEAIKGYIRGSVKDMQSLLIDVEKNAPWKKSASARWRTSG
jgi:hypothetical protein